MSSELRKKQIKYYTGLLKENEFLLLKSEDSFFKAHYEASPLNILTNFSGTEGEAIIDKKGNISLFVDTRYHILADKQVFFGINVHKMPLGETFYEAFKKCYPKKSILYVPFDIKLSDYMRLDEYFDLRTYKIPDKFLVNNDFSKKAPIFPVDKDIAVNDFLFKIKKIPKINSNNRKMLIFNLDEISYLTNLRSFQFKNSSNFRSILYLDVKNQNNILFVDKPLKLKKIEGLKYLKLSDFFDYINSIDDEIFIDYEDITLDKFLSIKKPVQNKKKTLSLLASIKQKSEIDYLYECYEKLDNAILNFKNKLKTGISEFDLVNLFESELMKTGAKSTSFKTIMTIGENSASIHYSSYDKNKILTDESLILLDCGGYWDNGYATDITRTFYFGTNPSDTYKKVYTYVLKAFVSCFLSCETDAKKLDKLAREILKPLEKEGFYFGHGLGHGIGTSVHQNPPRLSLNSKDIIKPLQVHSIEPGLYGKSIDGKEFGVRIENCVYFDIDYKRFSLSKFPFEELLIKYELLSEAEKEFVKKWQSKV